MRVLVLYQKSSPQSSLHLLSSRCSLIEMDQAPREDNLTIVIETVLTAFLLIFGASVVVQYLSPREAIPFDTVVFSTAHSVALQGLNPYDTTLLAPLQAPWYPTGYGPCPFLNPPLLLLLFSPLLHLDVEVVGWWWRLSSVFASIVGALILVGRPTVRGYLFALATTLCNVPLWAALNWGQFGGFLTLAIALCWKGLRTRSPLTLGVGLTLFACKPLTFYLFLLFIALEVMRSFKVKEILIACAVPAAAFLVTAIRFPSAMVGWWASGLGSQSGSEHSVFLFNTDTLGSLLSYLLGYTTPVPTLLFLVVIISTILGLGIYFRCKASPDDGISFLIPLSAITTPYGWLHDRVILALLPIYYWGSLPSRTRILLVIGLGCLQSAAAVALSNSGNLGSVWWYSWALLAVVILLRRSRET